jgi:glycosyltransferase domain-containing protein
MYKVALLIPTMNRPEFLIRQLHYYASVKCSHPIYIGDASSIEIKDKIESDLGTFSNIIDVHYHHLPSLNIRKTITRLAELAKEDYCAIICDDDYLVPDSLTKCAMFLAENVDYRTAQGKAIVFALNESGPYGSLKNSNAYWRSQSIEFSSASERIKYFADNYWVPQFSVHRKIDFLEDSAIYRDIEDESFGELLHCFTFICKGKSKFLDCLYLIRQVHESRYLSPGILDWITGAKWYVSYLKFIDSLSLEISKHDCISAELGHSIINEAFKQYLGKVIYRKLRHTPNIGNSYNFQMILNKAKGIIVNFLMYHPGLKKKMKRIHASLFKRDQIFDFDSLLKKDSPYYKDCKPVFDNFSNGPLPGSN